MNDKYPNRFRSRIYSRAEAHRRTPEIGKLTSIICISLVLAVLWVGLTTETLPGLGYLR